MSVKESKDNIHEISDEEIQLILDGKIKEWNERYEIYLKNNIIPKLSSVHLQVLNLQRINLKNAIIEMCEFAGSNLSDSDLSNTVLNYVDLSGANLIGINLSHATLKNVSFTGANISGANLCDAKLIKVTLSGAKITWSNLSLTRIESCQIINANLLDSNFRGVYICRSDFYDSDLKGTDFSLSTCYKTNFMNANLHGSLLSNVQFKVINFTGANLSEVDFTDTTLERVNMTNANISSAILNGTHLIDSKLIGTNLSDNVLIINTDLNYAEKTHHDYNYVELSNINNSKMTNIYANQTVFGDLNQTIPDVRSIISNIESNEQYTEDYIKSHLINSKIPKNTDLSGSNLRGCRFYNIDLSEVILEKTDLSNAVFMNVNLNGTDFTGSNLHRSIFINAILDSTNFQNADISNSYIIDAILKNTNFTNANLSYSKIKLNNIDNIDDKCNIKFIGSKLVNAILSEDLLMHADYYNSNMIDYSTFNRDRNNKSNNRIYSKINGRLKKQNVILEQNEEMHMLKNLVDVLTPLNIIIALLALCLALARWLLPNPDKRYPDYFNLAIDGFTIVILALLTIILIYTTLWGYSNRTKIYNDLLTKIITMKSMVLKK